MSQVQQQLQLLIQQQQHQQQSIEAVLSVVHSLHTGMEVNIRQQTDMQHQLSTQHQFMDEQTHINLQLQATTHQ
eukprot:1904462-Amphidinium_carterae.1